VFVVVADPRPAARMSLRRLVEGEWRWTVVGEAVDGVEAILLTRRHDADVVLVDAAVGGLSHGEVAELLGEVSDAAVVGLLDAPHQHAQSPGPTVLKGASPERVRGLILADLRRRWRIARREVELHAR
jgi:chemotaxis response regulator CheB